MVFPPTVTSPPFIRTISSPSNTTTTALAQVTPALPQGTFSTVTWQRSGVQYKLLVEGSSLSLKCWLFFWQFEILVGILTLQSLR